MVIRTEQTCVWRRMVGSAHPTEVSIVFAIRSFDRTYRVGSYKIELSDQKRLMGSAHPTEVSIPFAIRSFDRTYRVGSYKIELSDQKRLVGSAHPTSFARKKPSFEEKTRFLACATTKLICGRGLGVYNLRLPRRQCGAGRRTGCERRLHR